ncbi:MAG: endonuclease V [Chloroflexi bacterium]|nr:endonuclease V [Chloroflexota bacterium]
MEWPLHHAHPWDLPEDQARAVQQHLRHYVRAEPLAWQQVRWVGGVDVSVRGDQLRAGIVVYDCAQGRVVDRAAAEGPEPIPYKPGFLSFREIPRILDALPRLHRRPEVLLVDGHGIAHPRHMGIAAHLGVLLDWPTVGVAKSPLVGHFARPLKPERGDAVPVLWRGQTLGMAVRTRTDVKPVWVSIGHRVTLPDAVALVLRCSRYRLPEPIRAAHRWAAQWGVFDVPDGEDETADERG